MISRNRAKIARLVLKLTKQLQKAFPKKKAEQMQPMWSNNLKLQQLQKQTTKRLQQQLQQPKQSENKWHEKLLDSVCPQIPRTHRLGCLEDQESTVDEEPEELLLSEDRETTRENDREGFLFFFEIVKVGPKKFDFWQKSGGSACYVGRHTRTQEPKPEPKPKIQTQEPQKPNQEFSPLSALTFAESQPEFLQDVGLRLSLPAFFLTSLGEKTWGKNMEYLYKHPIGKMKKGSTPIAYHYLNSSH